MIWTNDKFPVVKPRKTLLTPKKAPYDIRNKMWVGVKLPGNITKITQAGFIGGKTFDVDIDARPGESFTFDQQGDTLIIERRPTLKTLIKESWQEAKEAVERIMRRIR